MTSFSAATFSLKVPVLYSYLWLLSWCNTVTTLNRILKSKNLAKYHKFRSNFLFLKGQCHEIFCFWFFSWISFPPAPEYSIKTVSNFFENSRRYSQLKVCHRCQRHRWQMEKIFNQKNSNNFIWSPLGSRGNIYINFCLQVHFQVSGAWYCSSGKCAAGVVDTGGNLPPASLTPAVNFPPVLLIPVAICHRHRWHQR